MQAAASAARRRAAGLAVDSMFAEDAEEEAAEAAVDPAELAEARHRAELLKELKVLHRLGSWAGLIEVIGEPIKQLV